jgi:hypothetical protein
MFCVKLGKNAVETYELHKSVFGEKNPATLEHSDGLLNLKSTEFL